ncbi:hypothetical protein [Streptomyces halobius]|uniref:Uncharacterized protein n=1 Tax=Streptomyces halobius TaxID=2879846 RepID=A0ABY4MH06_9ACTN|nr:hypothetical protein [Streptomyces halobius]UQA97089.1 hypothetical protein K9S39_39140 [Streptomyces halobius]
MLIAGPALATATESPAKSAASDRLPAAVEDFSYPNAEKILQEKGIKLIRGDGHLTLADCGTSPQQIKVWTRNGDFCFQATAKQAYLDMEVPKVWALETAKRPISADLTAGAKKETVKVTKEGPQDGYQSVGEGTRGAETTLIRLRVTG